MKAKANWKAKTSWQANGNDPGQGNWQGWVQIKWKAGAPANAWKGWEKSPWVKSVWSTQGDWDCSVWLDIQTPDQMEEFVWKHVRKNKWVETTESQWVKRCA